MLLLYLSFPNSTKPYGAIIEEIQLLQDRVEDDTNLILLERETHLRNRASRLPPETRRILKKMIGPSKRFAKR